MIDRADLDHVAVATDDQAPAWERYAGDLGGRFDGGGYTPGFYSGQVIYENGMKVEVLEPYQVEQNDFLRRFLDRNGPGPHHLTFKVPDIHQALGAAEAAGYRPVNVDLSNPYWQEAFLHPKDAPGVVVQLAHSAYESAESGEGDDGWGMEPPMPMPESRVATPATLVHVAHAVASLDEGRRLFVDLLGGRETGSGGDEAAEWVDVAWPGPGRIRLLTPTAGGSGSGAGGPLAQWLGDRRGRVHHLLFTLTDPAAVPGAVALADGRWEVPTDANLGVRLLLANVS